MLIKAVRLSALVLLTGYLALCLFSYSPSDRGFSHSGDGGEIVNLGGSVGAWFADLLFLMFGEMAYLFLILLCLTVWRRYTVWRSGLDKSGRHQDGRGRGLGRWRFLLPLAGFLMALSGACGLEQIYFPVDPSAHIHAGGILGETIGRPVALKFGIVGAAGIFIGLVITGITLVGNLSWLKLMDRTGYAAFAVVAWLRKWRRARVEIWRNRKQGAKVRQQREAAVKQFRMAQSAKPSPKIEPKIATPAPSDRKLKEMQVNLLVDQDGDSEGDSDGVPEGASVLPELSLLDLPQAETLGYSNEELQAMSQLLVKKLQDFNVAITVEAVQPGPVVTRFEIEPAPGTKASQITGLSRDLARSLSVVSVRVVENIPGKSVVGIEIPNQHREIVRLVEGLSSAEYDNSDSPLSLVLGKDIAGNAVVTDLIKMPHVLIAGTTGSGKSVCVNALILSLLYKSSPEQVRMIMVDPKFLELSVYDGIPHLLAPVVTDMNKAANALRWCIVEMDRRFRLLAALAVRNIAGFNKKVAAANKAGSPLYDPTVPLEEGQEGQAERVALEHLPYIVVIVDELADLMMVAGKKIEEIIIRIAQRARAAGIHLVLATQRPSVDVVTGLIKANVPTRIAFQVSSRVDSRTVLDQMGAEQLLGQGDMLFLPPGSGAAIRVHGSFVSDEEVAKVVAQLKQIAAPVYMSEITNGVSEGGMELDGSADSDGESDVLYDDAVAFVTQSRKASISALQRALRVGYNRAARMIETMEVGGVVSPPDNGKREVLAPPPPE